MADAPVVHIGENSPERIAYTLLQNIMNVEKMSFSGSPSGGYSTADRKYILDTYAEALDAVQSPTSRL